MSTIPATGIPLSVFRLRTEVHFGDGAVSQVGAAAVGHGLQHVLVVSDRGVAGAGLLEPVTASLDAAGIAHTAYTEVEPDPSVEVVGKGLAQFQAEQCDGLVAVGGGSSMDTAKAIGILARNPGRLRDYEGMDKYEHEPAPLCCVPTTVGTASEVTPFLVITDKEARFKFTIGGRTAPPLAAFLDPQLVLGLPAPIAAATGMDALTHAIESYTSLLATPITEALTLHAIRLIAANLRLAVANSRNHSAMANMLIASCIAGIGFSSSRLGNVHALAHPLGAYFHVPHGVANAICLPHVMEFNALATPLKMIEIAQAMGEPVVGLGEMDAAQRAAVAVRRLAADVGIPPRLRDVGATQDAIPAMAADAFKSGNIPINPRHTTQDDLASLYERAL